ncbi:MAG: SPFH domain-containing protein [Clostridiales bacterium]|jgi:regulator of protease activity HflC (stomatin/prohibitin superfamily)|nr:SPFH domain-containing protein [Clostridiales bacterium]
METKNTAHYEEREPKVSSGIPVLIGNSLLMLAAVALIIVGAVWAENGEGPSGVPAAIFFVVGLLYTLTGWVFFLGLRILKPNEALVFTLFGKYYGTLKREGFFYLNPFVSGVNPAAGARSATSAAIEQQSSISIGGVNIQQHYAALSKKISLKVTTLNNDKQKINDQLGNPIIIGIVVVWKVVNPTKAVFNVDNYKEFLSIQCDSALRNIVRLYPYDTFGDDNEKTLRGSSQEISFKLKDEIQSKVEIAGIEIDEARITHLAYAPEIAAAMLQRQQASAVIDARQMIVEGAVGMVEMALDKLSANNIVALDDERKAAMVSNLMVVLCGNREAQPVINSGTLY